MPDLSYAISLPPEEAIKYFESKGYAITADWKALWQDAHVKAFTVAGVAKMDILQDIKGMIDKALKEGIPLDEFKKDLIPRLTAKGWLSDTPEKMPWRLENIYRTNMQTAYQAGRYREMMENVKNRPYWQYVAVMDSRTRPAHAALNGKVFRFDDVFWKTHYPPSGYMCRCRVRALSGADINERRLEVDTGEGHMIWEDKPIGQGYTKPTAAYVDPATGQKYFTDAGWSYNPGEKFWEPDLRKYETTIRTAFEKEMQGLAASAVQGIIQRLNIDATTIDDVKTVLKEYEKNNPGLFVNGFNNIFKVDEDYFMAAWHSDGNIAVSERYFLNSGFMPKNDLIMAFKKIKVGQALTFNNEYAVESLWHEIGHLRVKDYKRLTPDTVERICMETVNQFAARHTYDRFLKELGGTAAHKDAILTNGYGYSNWVRNFRALIKKIGVNETAVAKELEKTITASYQSVVKDTTGVLAKESVGNRQLKTAAAKRKALNKESGRIEEALGYLEEDYDGFIKRIENIWKR